MEKVDSMQEQMDNISREMAILRKNQMEMLEIKNKVTEVKNVFDGFISRLDMAEERISELENHSNFPNWNTKRKNNEQKRAEYVKLWNNIKRCNIPVIGISEGEEKENGAEEISGVIILKSFPKLVTDIKPQIQIT